MSDIPPAAQALTRLSVPYRLFRHEKQVTSLEQAAEERSQALGQVVRSILFRIDNGNFVMVLIAGPAQASWQTLRAYLGKSRLTMANKDEVLAVTGYQIGAVSPFGLPSPLRILADERVFIPNEISIGSGERGVAIILNSVYLRRIINNIEIGKFAEIN